MANNELTSVKDAVHKLQLCLLEGIEGENQLFASGSLMSRSDYQDVVTERSIANMCGYPLCRNTLPSEPSRKGRYRIALKEHRVYDLHETYMYCSTSCVVNSRAFAGSLQEERCSVLNTTKLNEVLRLFENLNLEAKEDLGKNGDLGISKLKIQENAYTQAADVSLEDWIGPSNAIEGYVPQKDRATRPSHPKNPKEASKTKHSRQNKGQNVIFDETDFLSAIIADNEYSISKLSLGPTINVTNRNSNELDGASSPEEKEDQFTMSERSSPSLLFDAPSKIKESNSYEESNVTGDELSASKGSVRPGVGAAGAKVEMNAGQASQSSAGIVKPSLKSSGSKKVARSVTWADDQTNAGGRSLCEYQEMELEGRFSKLEGTKEASEESCIEETSSRFASAEACAVALSQAAEAVASGESDFSEAVSEAGIIILPPPHDVNNEVEPEEDVDMLEVESASLKWPRKPGIAHSDLLDSEDSWYDRPPEGFSLTLSPFATMYMALFAWISSSSLAYIYGHDESFYEEYSFVNGREYPRKIVTTDGRSAEIKQTLAGCLARALPGLVADLRLPIPISSLEQGVGRLLDTLSFTDSLPPFRVKQWQVILLLFIDALSVIRFPVITSHMTSSRVLFHKVLDAAQIKVEEYEIMKDLMIPLGRVPQLSTQSGG